jgi:ribonuclease HII
MKRSEAQEWERLQAMSALERPFWDSGRLVAGVDEAGRGPLAGPCVAAAVIMPPGCLIAGVDDSKKLTEIKRERLYGEITRQALSYAVCIVDNRVIDEINILNAAKRAFAAAIGALSHKPSYVFCDRIGGIDVPYDYEELVGGDARVYSIAAASVIAKVTRDRLMRGYECAYPGYGFAQHKGYGTRAHAESIRAQGPCAIHRRSFLSGFGV